MNVYSHADCVDHWGDGAVTERQVCMGAPGKSACGVSDKIWYRPMVLTTVLFAIKKYLGWLLML